MSLTPSELSSIQTLVAVSSTPSVPPLGLYSPKVDVLKGRWSSIMLSVDVCVLS